MQTKRELRRSQNITTLMTTMTDMQTDWRYSPEKMNARSAALTVLLKRLVVT